MILLQLFFNVLNHESNHSDDGNDQGSEGQRSDVITQSSEMEQFRKKKKIWNETLYV
jgi:hypothetical protein